MQTRDNLPPFDEQAERAALACVLLAPSAVEQGALLEQLRPKLFFDGRHRQLFELMTALRSEGHAVDLVTLLHLAQARKAEVDAAWLSGLMDAAHSVVNFPHYLGILQDLAARRWTLQRSARLQELARNGEFSLETVKAELAELWEKTARIGEQSRPWLEIVTIEELKRYQPDPGTFLIGADMVSRGELCLIAGWAGLGKSRLANTLAFAGARGAGTWMGYEVKRQFRTLVLQCENSLRRLKTEIEDLPASYQDWVKFSKPCPLAFHRPEFRSELRRFWDQWPFDVLIIDHWLEVAREEGQADHMEALDNIWSSLPRGDKAPALVIIAHMRKQRGGENWRPKTGRELLSEVSGSYAIGAKARTVFVIQPATMEADDDRIVFDCAKSNNDTPLPMSAWHRRNGAFQPCLDFDFDTWLNPPDDRGGKQRQVTDQVMRDIFHQGRRALCRLDAVEALCQATGLATSTAYKYFDGGKTPQGDRFKDHLVEKDGLLWWRE
ncbi:MAG: AAA family ATPase [Verrucomicrobiae bacterium]|nr:AAA family ATPase [Verrucomicrobiae bacterium]